MSQVLIIHEMWARTCSEATEANIKLSQPAVAAETFPSFAVLSLVSLL